MRGGACGAATCLMDESSVTPTDFDLPSPHFKPGLRSRVDRFHPSRTSALGSGVGCTAEPLGAFISNPLTHHKYPHTSITVTGTVRDSTGTPIPGARVDVWQVDPYGRTDMAPATPLAEALTAVGVIDSPFLSTEGDCRAVIFTDSLGQYTYTSLLPGVYGPPQHLNFYVQAEGMVSLTTNMYVADDPYFKELLHDELEGLLKDSR